MERPAAETLRPVKTFNGFDFYSEVLLEFGLSSELCLIKVVVRFGVVYKIVVRQVSAAADQKSRSVVVCVLYKLFIYAVSVQILGRGV